MVVLTVNLDLGDLPFRTAFPILAMNTLNYFAGGQGELKEVARDRGDGRGHTAAAIRGNERVPAPGAGRDNAGNCRPAG